MLPTPKRKLDWIDLECVAILERNDNVVEYTAFQVMGREHDNTPLFMKAVPKEIMESTTETSEAEVWCIGTVDEEGVITYDFVTPDACQIMGRPHAMKFGEVFMRIFDVACELMPEYANEMRKLGTPCVRRGESLDR